MSATDYIECGCGCGERVPAITKKGTRARFKHNHHARINPLTHYEEDDRGYETPCWIWQGGTQERGYGRASFRGVLMSAHRLFYEQFVGPIPEGLQIDHLCRNPSCVNPDHLEPVTLRENNRRGSRTKLTPDMVREIRRIYADAKEHGGNAKQGVIPAMASRFGVSYRTVQRAASGGPPWEDVA